MPRLWMILALVAAPSLALAQTETSSTAPGAPRTSTPPREPAPPPRVEAPPPMATPRPAPAPAPPPSATAAPQPRAEAPEAPVDHAAVVDRIGVGFEGFPAAFGAGTTTGGLVAPSGPIIGARWWFSERTGLDLGAGLVIQRGGGTTEGSEEEPVPVYGPASTGILLRAGVPFVLYARSHYTFLAQGHLLFGYSRRSYTQEIDDGIEMRESKTVDQNYRVDVTASLGAEVHFGFIGIPELTLQGTVGMGLTHAWSVGETESTTYRYDQTQLTTSVGSAPWDFFRTAVAARYYF